MNYLLGFCGLLLLALTVVAWRLDVVSERLDVAKANVTAVSEANVTLQTKLERADRAARERELRLREIEASLTAARSAIRKVPTDACIDTPVPAAISDSLRH